MEKEIEKEVEVEKGIEKGIEKEKDNIDDDTIGRGRIALFIVVFVIVCVALILALYYNRNITENMTGLNADGYGTAADDTSVAEAKSAVPPMGNGVGANANGDSNANNESGGANNNSGANANNNGGANNSDSNANNSGGANANANANSGASGASGAGGVNESVISMTYDVGENTEFLLYKNYLVKCSRDSFSVISKNGEELLRYNIDFQRPALACGGDYLLAYDIGGRSAFVIEDRSVKWEDNFSNNIITATINKNGYMAVVTEENGYRNSVKVFAPLGKELFTRVVADDYVVFAQISNDNAQMMVNRIKTTGINVKSGLEFIDLKSDPLAVIESGEGKPFLGTTFIDDNNFSVATETDFTLYNANREAMVREKYDVISSMCEFPAKSCTVAAQKNGESIVTSFNAKMTASVLLKTEFPVVNMSSNGDFLVVNTGNQVFVVGSNGKVRNNLYFEADVLYTDIYNKTYFLVVTEKRAELFKINK